MSYAARTLSRSMIAVTLLATACDRGPELPPEGAPAEAEPVPTELTPPIERAAEPSAMAAERQAPAPVARFDAANPVVAGVHWQTPEVLVSREPAMRMRAAEYAMGEGDAEAVLTVYHFPGMGGSIQDNVDRWVGQFQGPDGSPAASEVETKTVGGLDVTVVDVSGTFESGMPMGGQQGPQGGQRLLGAIVAGPNGPVFFKFLGPATTVAEGETAFSALVDSFSAS